MANAPLHGQIRAYEKRHPGRDPFCDALAGLLWAAPEALETWLHERVVPTCRRALLGKKVDAFPPLPSWLRGILLMHLHTQERYAASGLPRLEDCPNSEIQQDSSYRLWANDRLLMSFLTPEPLSWLTALLNCHVALAVWQRGLEGPALVAIIDSILGTTLEFHGKPALKDDDDAPKARKLIAIPVLDYCRKTVVGMSGVTRQKIAKGAAHEDRVTRRFSEGIEAAFKHENLGTPSVADLALLAQVSGLECDDPKFIRDRWKKRRRQVGGEHGESPGAPSSPAT